MEATCSTCEAVGFVSRNLVNNSCGITLVQSALVQNLFALFCTLSYNLIEIVRIYVGRSGR